MDYTTPSLVQQVRNTPPRCLEGYAAEPLEAPGAVDPSDTLASFRVTWQLACPCGSASLHLLGHPHPGIADTLLCPLSTQCARCGRNTALFDIRKDGYDAEYGYCGVPVGSGDPRQWACPRCAGIAWGALAECSYQFEAGDFDAAQAAHVQDFFDWFSLEVRCDQCGEISHPVSYECA